MKLLYYSKKGYPVYQYEYDEWQRVKEKPKSGIILSKAKSKEK